MGKERESANLVSSHTGIAVTISGNPVVLGVGNTEYFRVTGRGNIGINTIGSLYNLDIWANSASSNDVGIRLRATNYAYINFTNNAGNATTWFMGHVGSQNDEKLTIRYGTGPADLTGPLYLHKGNMVSVGSGSTTGDSDTTLQVMNGGAYFANTVGIGRTIAGFGGGNYSLITDDRIYCGAGYDITPGSTYDSHITANFSGYTGGIAGDSSTMYVGHNSASRELSFQTNETTRMVIGGNNATVAIGYTNTSSFSSTYSLALYGHLYMRNDRQISWNSGDVNIKGNQSSGGYGLKIESYNSSLGAMVPSIYTSGSNRAVGINTDYTSSSWGMYVQKGNGNTYESGYTGAIYARGSVYSYAGQYLGGLGSMSTSGTTNWNDATNARSGNGYTLLTGNATNGPTATTNYFHAISFEYSSKNGSGNLCQFAIPYYGAGLDVYYRTRYSGTWSSWTAV